MKRLGMLIVVVAMLVGSAAGQAQSLPTGFIGADEWAAYRSNFITEGRVVDSANGGISHSEGQGYGMLLAYLADDRETFEALWRFTHDQLQVRQDGLLAWRWEPDVADHVTDTNNASDGDTLVAYALALAGSGWGDNDKTMAARRIVHGLASSLVQIGDLTAIAPAVEGFSPKERTDGPVVNPSYWIYEAYPLFAQLEPDAGWDAVAASGLAILDRARFGTTGLPSDWVALGNSDVRPAKGFPAEFSYNAIRIPLYLMRAELGAAQLEAFSAIGNAQGIGRVEVETGALVERLAEPGYRLIQAAIDCTLSGTPVPPELARFAPTTYFAATIQLLLLDHLRRNQPLCLEDPSP